MLQGLRSMVGMTKKSIDVNVSKGRELEYANDLNKFYARFDNHDFSDDIQTCISGITDSFPCFEVKDYEVYKHFCKLKSNKAWCYS